MPGWLSIPLGIALIAAALLDVFMTVLFARSGTGIISRRLARALWFAFRRVGRSFPRARDRILSYSGPVILVVMIGVWVWMLVFGFALMFWPALGRGIVSAHPPTPTDFWTAIYVSGSSVTTVGNADLYPVNAFNRVLPVIASVLGISVLTLCLTYLLEIYNALLRRNTFALRLHHGTGDTGDAAVLLAGLVNEDISAARSGLASFSVELLNLYESQHFYAELMFFRFRNPAYSLARVVQVTMARRAQRQEPLRVRRRPSGLGRRPPPARRGLARLPPAPPPPRRPGRPPRTCDRRQSTLAPPIPRRP